MTDYKSIFGKPIKTLTTDPTDTGAEGQIWYNSTAAAFKSVLVTEAWSSASPVINARSSLDGFGLSPNAGLAAGGSDGTNNNLNLTEEYNGSGWSTGGTLNTGRNGMAAFGSLTAGVAAGGANGSPASTSKQSAVEEYDGSAWTSVTSLPQIITGAAGSGIQTAGLFFAGAKDPTGFPVSTATLTYDGSTWTSVNSMNTGGTAGVSAKEGPQTATLFATGLDGASSGTNQTEEYDGTSWTAAANAPWSGFNGGGFGTQTDFLLTSGNQGGTAAQTPSAKYDGTTWSTGESVATGRDAGSSHGSSSGADSGFYSAGRTPGSPAGVTTVEEFNRSASVITAAAWASGGNLGTTRNQGNVAGAQTAGLLFGGETPPGPVTGATEEYDGSTWTAGGTMGTARFDLGTGSAGTQTAALGAGGFSPGGRQSATEEYDGSTWTAGGALPTGRYEHGIFGTQTAGVVHNGTVPGPSITNTTFEYDGSTWTAGGNTSVTGFARGGAGTLSAGKAVGARTAPSTYTADVEDYDGTSWTAGVNFFRTIQGTATGGTQTATIVGNNPLASPSLYSATFDGTGWATAPSLATARQRLAGTTQLAIAASGSGSEEFTGETSANNFKTLTTS